MSGARVYLVGAGPGDAGLVTVKGARLLGRAAVVVYDYLSGEELLSCANPDAKLVYVGKKGFSAHVTQDEVNEVLVDEARRLDAAGGGVLVRLKGGDPFVFGRGGEEALALARAGIPFEVVPGVTSGVAAPASAGMPVTHRGLSSSVTFVAGREDPGKRRSSIDWGALASLVRAGGTLCFYMGMRGLPLIVGNLMRCGVRGDMPAAVVQRGATASQRTVAASLEALERRVAEEGVAAPAIILVGAVASLRDDLAWFEDRPLFGRRIVVTRPRPQARILSERLRELGAEVLEFPAIRFGKPLSSSALDAALAALGGYDWVVFTSANGVDAFFGRLELAARRGEAACGDARALGGCRVAAIGPATAGRLASRGIVADAVPGEYRGEAVFEAMREAEELRGGGLADARVLIPRAQEAREALPELLRGAGAQVDVVSAYRTLLPEDARADELAARIETGEVDAVTFTSPSTVRNLAALLGRRASLLRRVELASIGPVTSAALRELGLEPACEAAEYTTAGLLDALAGRSRGKTGGEIR